MEIKIITKDGIFIDAISSDTNLLEWGSKWIKDKDDFFDIEFWNDGSIHIVDEEWGTFLIFKGDNGRIELDITTKII